MGHTILFVFILLLGWGELRGSAQAAPFAYLTSGGSPAEGRVTVIDTATHTVLAHVPIAGRPGNVVVHPAGTWVYVATNEGNTVAVIETTTHTVLATIPVSDGPTAVAVHPAGTALYVARAHTARLAVIDTTTHATIADVPMPHRGATTMAIHPAGTTVYVTHPGSATITVLDTATHTVIDTDGDGRNGLTGIAGGLQPTGLAVHPAGTALYVTDQASNTVVVIETTTHRPIAIGATPRHSHTGVAVGRSPMGVAVHPAGTRVYVANGDCTIAVLAVASSASPAQVEVIDTITVDDCDTLAPILPWGLAVTPDGTAVYVANAHDSGHPILDTSTHQLIGLIHETGGHPLAGGSEVLSPFIGPMPDPAAQEQPLGEARAGGAGGRQSPAAAARESVAQRHAAAPQPPSAFAPSVVAAGDQAAIRLTETAQVAQAVTGTVSGTLRKWHTVTLTFNGPSLTETAPTFTNYRLDVTFTAPSGVPFTVPGYWAADGNAANTSATAGNKWMVRFTPNATGTWTFTPSCRTGTNIAMAQPPPAGTPCAPFDATPGSFVVGANDKPAPDLRAKGRLQVAAGKHHLKWAETNQYFFKAGPDAPEGMFGAADFDNTPNGAYPAKTWANHIGDWVIGNPTWKGTKGKGIIGALNYLSVKGMTAFSMLAVSVAGAGDTRNVFPFCTNAVSNCYDVSKLAQWQIVLDHAETKGLLTHMKLFERENALLMDSGNLGDARKLYIREMVARFGHLLGLEWNIAEETAQSGPQIIAMAQRLWDVDPYDHPIVLHTFIDQTGNCNSSGNEYSKYDLVKGPLSQITGVSLQAWRANGCIGQKTLDLVKLGDSAGRPWVVSNDEQGSANEGVLGTSGNGGSCNHLGRCAADAGFATNWDTIRKDALWGNLMAGGAGVMYYYGYSSSCSDMTCQDHRTRDGMFTATKRTLDFLTANGVPFWNMANYTGGLGAGAKALKGATDAGVPAYVVYMPAGAATNLDMTTTPGTFTRTWFNPRTGVTSSGTNVTGGAVRALGSPPSVDQDWAQYLVCASGCAGSGATNLLTNPTFAVNTVSWQGSGGTIARVTTACLNNGCLKLETTANKNAAVNETTGSSGAGTYTASAWVRNFASSGTEGVKIRIFEYDASNTHLATFEGVSAGVAQTYVKISATYSVTDPTHKVTFAVFKSNAISAVLIDEVALVRQ
jgi:YVTN family beta-propeller protein